MNRTHFDYWLLITTILLIAGGIVMVYSASAMLAADQYGDAYYFLKKEIVFVVLGALFAVAAANVPYGWWRRAVYPLLGLSIVLIVLTYVPGFRSVASGAARWLRVGPLTFQPSELAKVAFICFLAYSLEKKEGKLDRFGVGVCPHLLVGGVLMVLILGEKDLGSVCTMGAVMMCMLFVSGARLVHLVAITLAALPVVYYAIAGVAYRRARILAFLDPWSDRYGSGFQIIQSLVSFHQGGVWGRGLGEGQQKLFYLPEAHTDFIAAVLGEELGLIGMVVLVSLFMVFALRGFSVASRAPDRFGRYLALGVTLLIGVEVIANLCVVMGILPTKGMVLPFISYGGSSLLVSMTAVGVLLNVSTYGTPRAARQVES